MRRKIKTVMDQMNAEKPDDVLADLERKHGSQQRIVPHHVNQNTMNLNELREANVRRCEQVFHPLESWTPTDWACAMAGEAGEVCNAVKKLRRMSDGTNTAKDPQTEADCIESIAYELADTIIYADLLAARLGINLSEAVRAKFNAVSDRMNSTVRLDG